MNNKKVIINNAIDWVCLSGLGKSKVVQSFSIWIILVPLISKLILSTPESINIPLVDQNISIELALPFNLVVFYFCAFFFSISSILYAAFCPELIKNYRDVNHFMEKNGNYVYLENILDGYKKGPKPDLDKILDRYEGDDRVKAMYFTVINHVKLKKKKLREAIAVFYLIGGVLLSWVIVDNTVVVILGG